MGISKNFHTYILPIRHKLYRFALRILGNVEEAEDVVQEVLLKMWKLREQTDQYTNVEAWCMRITKNLSLDKLKSGYHRFHVFPEKMGEDPGGQPSPEKQAHLSETLQRIHDLMDAMPEKQRMAIQLRDMEGYSYKEIAHVLEITVDQVKVALHRGRKHLKTELLKVEAYGL